jgi:hypothetical protein
LRPLQQCPHISTWMHFDHPVADTLMTPKYANRYDIAFFQT